MTNITADIYPSFDGYICKINVPDWVERKKSKCETIVILDRSGSMGNNVARFYNKILPNVFEKLDYDNQAKITTISFDNGVITYSETLNTMKNRYIQSGDTTYMSNAIKVLKDKLANLDNENLRLLTISDGELHDQELTLQLASELSKSINDKYNINSQAIRLFTSKQEPDTRGLASILQLNTKHHINLVDINSNYDNDLIITQIVSLFYDDGLDMSCHLVSDIPCMMLNPWSESNNNIPLSIGDNTVWLDKLPNKLSIGNIDISLVQQNDNISQIENILKPKLDFYLNKLRVLKVVNTVESREEINCMMEYLSKLQQWIEMNNTDTIKFLNNNSLRGRMNYFKSILERRKKTLFQIMQQVANDDRVDKLNSAQQAEYLRTVSSTKNTKALSRRALNDGINFDDIVRTEVRQMHKNLYEIISIDDTDHVNSFYSQETTLSGIKNICSLVDENIIDELSASEILQMINIVGVAVNAQIGNYVDPMCWRINHIYPGCYISISDITMAHLQSHGKKLYVPGFQNSEIHEITSVVPIFENLKIAQFLKSYAPSIMEYSASIGMRRMIVGINMTNGYTMCAGILKMLEVIDKTKSSINIETFIKFMNTYDVFVGNYFEHILKYVKEQDPELTYFIGNNGLTNMIHPIYKLVKTNNTKFIPQILRSIYSFESYQIVKRIIKKNNSNVNFINETLIKLLGIDFKLHGTPIPELFEPMPKPQHHEKYYIDNSILETFTSTFSDSDYMAMLPKLLAAVNADNSIDIINSIPSINEKMICRELGINYDLRTYKFYSLIQSLIYSSKKSRVDDSNYVMKVPDLSNQEEIEKFIKTFVSRQYFDEHQSRLTQKNKEEKTIVKDMLVEMLVNCSNIEYFCDLLRNGLTYRSVYHTIANNASYGFIELKNGLMREDIFVPERSKKLIVFFTGKDLNNQIVWNNGNLLRIKISDYEWIFNKYNGDNAFKYLKDLYKKSPTHIYRVKPNRQGHFNDKPSYWAYGYQTLEEMVSQISDEEWDTYKKIHYDCCGVNGSRSGR